MVAQFGRRIVMHFAKWVRVFVLLSFVTKDELAKRLYKTSDFDIEDVVQRSEITRFCTETGTSTTLGKPLTAKLLCTAIENGSFELNKQSIDNFQKLFDRIARYTA